MPIIIGTSDRYAKAGGRHDRHHQRHPAPQTFRNHSVEFMQQLKAIQRPIILLFNGNPEAVVQDAAASQHLLDIAALLMETKQSGRA